eukprot:1713121-Rhodomonas_salina.4
MRPTAKTAKPRARACGLGCEHLGVGGGRRKSGEEYRAELQEKASASFVVAASGLTQAAQEGEARPAPPSLVAW